MQRLYLLMVPLAVAGAYWLALLRLRQVGIIRSWLETVGLNVLYLVGTGALIGVGSYYFERSRYYLPPTLDHPWWVLTLFSEVSIMILYVVILLLASVTIGVGFASLFARWNWVRFAHLPSSGWRDFLLVFAGNSAVAFLTGFTFAFLPDQLFVLCILPGAIVSAIVSWQTYRTLYRAWQSMPSPEGTTS